MWTRREAVAGGALTLLFGSRTSCSCAAESADRRTAGCLIADAHLEKIYPNGAETRVYLTGDEPILFNFGDKNFDVALAHTLAKLSQRLQVLPGFAYYDDTQTGQNAYATPRVRLSRADGTVLMGTNLFNTLRKSREHPDVAVVAVCAHEFGHILQFKHGLIQKVNAGQPTVKRSELQADFFAGYFAGLRKRERPEYPAAVIAMTQFNVGDHGVGDRNHHGTPKERGAAVVRGFELGFRENKNLSDAIQESTSYVMSL